MIEFRSSSENGSTNGWMIVSIVSFVFILALGGLSVWAYMSYNEQKTNVDGKIKYAVDLAVKEQADKDAANFLQQEKYPFRTFDGPYDLGGLSFQYPKTWSVFIENDASSGSDYEAYFYKDSVPPISDSQQYMLRVTIEESSYDSIVSSYDDLVEDGKLKSSTYSVNGVNGTRLDGSFSDDIRGSAVLFKVRDKTVTVRTDADTFKSDFDTLAATIKFE